MFIRLFQLFSYLLFVISTNVMAVVGGQDIADKDWPFVVSLHTVDDKGGLYNHSCGGAYIGQGLIISAAHCAISFVPAESSVACMGNSGAMVENNCYSLKSSTNHPSYDNNSNDGDITIYQMDTIPEGYPRISLITELENSTIQAGDILQIMGLGSTTYSEYDPAYNLQGAKTPIIDNASCNNLIIDDYPDEIDDDVYICSGIKTLGPAQGDSGTPAFITGDNGPTYAALVTTGYNYTGIFTRIAFYLDWINQTRVNLVGAIDYPRNVLFKVSDQANSLTRNIQLLNQSEEAIRIEDINIDNDSFTLHDANCDLIAAGSHCEMNISVLLNEENETGELSFTIQNQIKHIDLLALKMTPEPSVENWQAPFQTWLSGGTGQWQDEDNGVRNGYAEPGKDLIQILEGEIEGPGVVSFFSNLRTYSGNGRLRILLDGKQQYQFSGSCFLDSYTVEIPAGIHSLSFEYQDNVVDLQSELNTKSVQADEALISTLTLFGFEFSADMEQGTNSTCSYNVKDNDSKSVDDVSSSGGGGIGFSSGILVLLTLIRRRTISDKAN